MYLARRTTLRRARVAVMQEGEAVGIVVPTCPHIGRGYSCHRGQVDRTRTTVALNLVPLRTVPVQHQRYVATYRERFVIANRPHVVRRYSVQVVQVDQVIGNVGE